MNEEITIGVIGGSGVYDLDEIKILKEYPVNTPYGKPSSNIYEARVRGVKFLFIPRHGTGHTILPSEINYRANIYAMKKMGVKYLLSISAVGSLKDDYPPTTFVLPSQFLDWTKGIRERTFFGDGLVGHVSVADPVCLKLQKLISRVCDEQDIKHHRGGTYVCIEGPQFSSRSESFLYKSFNADIIGMTNVPESYLAKEAGMSYATVAMVTDYDCWKDENCSLTLIMEIMKQNYISAQKLIANVIPEISKENPESKKENENCIVTRSESITAKHREVLEVILK